MHDLTPFRCFFLHIHLKIVVDVIFMCEHNHCEIHCPLFCSLSFLSKFLSSSTQYSLQNFGSFSFSSSFLIPFKTPFLSPYYSFGLFSLSLLFLPPIPIKILFSPYIILIQILFVIFSFLFINNIKFNLLYFLYSVYSIF